MLRLSGEVVPQKLPKLAATPNGSLSTNLEFILPPGTKGVVPNLSFSYTSGGSNGILGVGWELSGLYSIHRDPSFGVNYDGTDDFVSSLSGQLVDVSGNRREYHARKESWVRYIPNGICGDGPCSWTAIDKDGIQYTFGSTDDSRIESIGRNGSIRTWAVSRVRDPFGNGYDVNYRKDSSNGDYYPDRISYQNRVISFVYENRNDTVPEYWSGGLVKVVSRLSKIRVYADNSLTREYRLNYSNGNVSGRSTLTSVSRSENNAFDSVEYDDLTFQYGSDSFGLDSLEDSNLNTTLSSLNLFVPSGLLLYVNLLFMNPFPTQASATEARLADCLQYAMHMPIPERDSCNTGPAACLCAAYAPCWGGNPHFFENLVSVCLDYNNWGGPMYCASGIDSGLTNWMSMDLDGDGMLDFASVVGSETNNSIRLRAFPLKNGVVDSSMSFLSPELPLHYNTFSQAADLNGDGRTDFAFESGGKLNVIYSQSNSFTAPTSFGNVNIPAANRNMTVFAPYSYYFEYSNENPKRLTADKAPADWFSDMNGDGLTDFIHHDGSNFQIYLNRKGSFANPISIPGSSNYFMNEFIDLNSDGKSEYVRLIKYSENPEYTALHSQLDQANSEFETTTNSFVTKQDILNRIVSSGANAVSISDFNSLIDYYLIGCGVYIQSLGVNIDLDALVLLPNSAGVNTACVNTDPNYLDIMRLQNTFFGGSIPDPNAMSNDLQLIYASLILPIASKQSSLQSQINSVSQSASGAIRYRLEVTTFDLEARASRIAQLDLGTSADSLRSFFADVNSDGLPDFLTIVGNQVKISLNTSNGFASQVSSLLHTDNGKNVSQFNFGDVNSDGLQDLILYNKDTQSIESYLSDGSGGLKFDDSYGFGKFTLQEQNANGIYNADIGQIMIQDVNGDGFSDALMLKLLMDKTQGHVLIRKAKSKSVQEDDLLWVSNGVQKTSVEYTSKHLHPGAILAGTGEYPNLVDTSSRYLVTGISTDIGSGISVRESFQYRNGRIYAGTRGIARTLGFEKFTEKETSKGFYKIAEFFQNDYRLAGIPKQTGNYNASGNLISQTIYSGFKFPNPFGTEIAVSGNISESSYHNGLIELTKDTSLTLDSFGFPINQTVAIGDHIKSTQTNYLHDLSAWRIGRSLRNKESVDGTVIKDQQINYVGDLIVSTVQFPGTIVEQTTSFSYNSYGNPIEITDAMGSKTQFSYDSEIHNYIIEKKNVLGQIEKTSYDSTFGLEIAKTDISGGTISKTYDGYGRLSTVTYPGNGDWNESYEYRNPARLNLTDLNESQYTIKIIRDATSGKETVTKEFADPFGNEIRKTAGTAIDGIELITDTIYDYTTGQIRKKSVPYFSNSAPYWTEYLYEDSDLRLTGNVFTDKKGKVTTTFEYSGLTTNSSVQYPDGTISTTAETRDELGQVVSKTENGKTIRTIFTSDGQPAKITDPAGKNTYFTYDQAGRKISTADSNSGLIRYQYDSLGNLIRQVDARGKTLSFQYDAIGRLIATIPSGGEPEIRNEYDDSSRSFGMGRLTKVTDGSGTTEFSYNVQGKPILERKVVDENIFITETEYDSLGRPIHIRYPDGTDIFHSYSHGENIEKISMNSADGNSNGVTVVEYVGPIFRDDQVIFRKKTGNGVVTDAVVNPSSLRTESLSSVKEDGNILQAISFEYDGRGNILKESHAKNTGSSKTFTYDLHNRLLSSSGSFGTEDYRYSEDGNLIRKGNYIYKYGDPDHVHAVTRAQNPGSGNIDYSYDASGNMVSRNGDSISYDSYGKMIEYLAIDGTKIKYTYDFAGNRVKTENWNAATVTYNLADYYEIVQEPGVSPKHTLYIKGIGGENLVQITRNDAVLLAQGKINKKNTGESILSISLENLGFCNGVLVDCGDYWKNRISSSSLRFLAYLGIVGQTGFLSNIRVFYILFILAILYVLYPMLLRGNELLQRMRFYGLGSPALLLSFFGLSILSNCDGFIGQRQTQAPWFSLAGGASSPEVTPVAPGIGSGGISGPGVPALGAYFYLTDHLGSTTALTDGYGNPASGPGQSGVSSISYRPYGEINYADSSGPDIVRYKFTGQIADPETGLYFYKSRYYDPFLGRFIQGDDRADRGINGLNRYMYVGGNPMNRVDPDGHSLEFLFWLSAYLFAQQTDSTSKQAQAIGLYMLQHNQVLNTHIGACPFSGINPGVFGNFQGAGRCGGSLPKDTGKFMLIALALKDPVLALAYYFTMKPKSPLTIVDKSGVEHDEEHKWSTSSGAAKANEQWIKQSFSNYFSISNQKDAYWREYDSLPSSYDRFGNTSKSIIAGVNYIAVTVFDQFAIYVGTELFAIQNVFAYTNQFLFHATFVHKNRYLIRKSRYKIKW